jgi:hypothetical protein
VVVRNGPTVAFHPARYSTAPSQKNPGCRGLAATGVPFSGSWLMRQPMKEPWEELPSLPADMGLNSRCDRVFPSGTFLSLFSISGPQPVRQAARRLPSPLAIAAVASKKEREPPWLPLPLLRAAVLAVIQHSSTIKSGSPQPGSQPGRSLQGSKGTGF